MSTLPSACVAVHRDVLIDAFGVDHAAVAQRDALLLARRNGVVQRDVAVLHDDVLGNVVIDQSFDHSALEQMLLDDLGTSSFFTMGIECAFGIDDHNRAERAETEAAGSDDLDFIRKTVLLQLILKLRRSALLPEEVQPVPPQIST